jgi:plastocyanin
MRRAATSLLLVLAAPLALGACGDDDDPAAVGTTATTAGGAAAPEPGTEAGPVTIDIAEFAFDPQEIEVAAGAEIVWTNADDFAHTARAEDGAFDTGDIAGGGTTSDPVVLEEPGTYTYFCGIHNSMTGTITVTG